MYPFLRMATTMLAAKFEPSLPPEGRDVSHHRAMPWDLDLFGEVNNGRILSLYDLGRFHYSVRVGLVGVLRREGWALTIAGSSIRYRHRLHAFQRYDIHTRCIGRDARFFYISQSMWRGETALSHGLYRTAVVQKGGIVETDRVAEAMGAPGWNPSLPEYAKAWIEAEAERPWPPENHTQPE